ncbi:MAG TPA: metal-sulfur cluster assembly factor [Alphaproteobacteria bacterium]
MDETEIREALREVIDPEIGINIVDLGLVYGIEVADDRVRIEVTMTTPACPLGDYITREIRGVLQRVTGSRDATEVVLVWDPPWKPEMMSDAAKRALGWTPDNVRPRAGVK